MNKLSSQELLMEGELISGVNALLLDDEPDLAAKLVEEATPFADDEDATPFAGSAVAVAVADIALYNRDYQQASDALVTAAAYLENPDAHLLRRARVAFSSGDIAGATAHVRRLLELYPSEGTFLWFHTILTTDREDKITLLRDLERATSRLHPESMPLDFEMAAYKALGDDDRVDELFKQGMKRDCAALEFVPSEENCEAWYMALAGRNLDDALRKIESALAAEGMRSDFLDTKAMVHFARGETQKASTASREAAKMTPDDIYMLWQFELLSSQQHSDAE